ncbi:MAG: glutamine amidotransferase [bacterium]
MASDGARAEPSDGASGRANDEPSDLILVLKTGEALPPVRSRYGDFEDWIAHGLGRPVENVEVAAVHEGDPLPAAETLAGVVVTGSPAMVSERAEWSERSARWLADAVSADAVPVLGLCYGHQLLAHALGGVVGPNPRGREMGTVEVFFSGEGLEADAKALLPPLFRPGVFPGHCSHVESVLRPPEGAKVLARTRLDPHSAIAYGPRQWGVQFHPEFDLAIMRGYVEARREVLIAESLDPDAMRAKARETPELRGVLSRFAAATEARRDAERGPVPPAL